MNKFTSITLAILCLVFLYLFFGDKGDHSIKTQKKPQVTTKVVNAKSSTKRQHSSRFMSPLQKVQNEIKRLQLAETIDDLYTPLNDEDNAALILNDIFLNLDKIPDAVKDVLSKDYRELNPEEKKGFLKLIQSPEALSIIEQAQLAATKQGADFKLDYSKGPALTLGHLSSLRKLNQFMVMTSQAQQELGSQTDSFNTTLTALKLANFADDDLTIIGNLVGQSNQKKILNALPSKLNRDQRHELYSILENNYLNTNENNLRSIDGERIIFGSFLDKLQQESNVKDLFGDLNFPADYSSQNEQAFYIQQLIDLREIGTRDYFESTDELSNWNQTIESQQGNYPLSAEILPALDKIHQKSQETLTQTQLRLIQLKIADYQETHGTAPDTLKDLALSKEYLLDKYSGQEIQFSQHNGKIKLSSQGKDKEIAIEF